MSKTRATVSPVDGSVYVERPLATAADVQYALERAVTAQAEWRNTSIAERAEIGRKAVDVFLANQEAIAEEISWQMGRPIRYAAGEVAGLAERAHHMIAIADSALATIELPQKEVLFATSNASL
jgi:acyl-CoA reductase-like NAD-dependent aldehyde dehydrogenase